MHCITIIQYLPRGGLQQITFATNYSSNYFLSTVAGTGGKFENKCKMPIPNCFGHNKIGTICQLYF